MRSRFRSLSRQMICSRCFSELLWVVSISRATSLIFFFLATPSTGMWKLYLKRKQLCSTTIVHDGKKPVKTWFDSLSFVFVVFLSSGGRARLSIVRQIYFYGAWLENENAPKQVVSWDEPDIGVEHVFAVDIRVELIHCFIATWLHDTWFVLHCNIWMRWVVVLDGCFLPELQIKKTCDINCTHLWGLYKSSVNL